MKAIEDVRPGDLLIIKNGQLKPWRSEKVSVIGVAAKQALKGETVIIYNSKVGC